MTDELPCGCATMCGTCRRELARHGLPVPPEPPEPPPRDRQDGLRGWLRRLLGGS